MVPFDILGMISYLCAIVTVSKTHRFEVFNLELYSDLETRVHSISSEPTSIDPPSMTS